MCALDPNEINKDDETVVASDLTQTQVVASAIPMGKTLSIPTTHAIADTGATSIFVMAGTPMDNVRQATNPLSINLPNREVVQSKHVCNIIIPGLLITLTRHGVPGVSMASLLGILILCKAGCSVIFTDNKCVVKYQGRVKDPTTDIWTLPLTPAAIKMRGKSRTSQQLQAGLAPLQIPARVLMTYPASTGQRLHTPPERGPTQ